MLKHRARPRWDAAIVRLTPECAVCGEPIERSMAGWRHAKKEKERDA